MHKRLGNYSSNHPSTISDRFKWNENKRLKSKRKINSGGAIQKRFTGRNRRIRKENSGWGKSKKEKKKIELKKKEKEEETEVPENTQIRGGPIGRHPMKLESKWKMQQRKQRWNWSVLRRRWMRLKFHLRINYSENRFHQIRISATGMKWNGLDRVGTVAGVA